MSNFRYSRLAVARLFTQLACLAMPDGEPHPYIKLLEADGLLKWRIKDVKDALKAEGESR